ncbi:hypothetical protein [Hyphomonas sp.]|uniref:hypothetical protein n=1 Tax=Hyphomonas sp. TaxID=87 RepID=UPI0030F8BB60
MSATEDDDPYLNAASADDVVETFQSFCLVTDGDATDAWTAATDSGWTKVPTVQFDPYIWGIKPYHRVGLASPDSPGLILILTAEGQVTSDHRRRFRAGLVTEGSPIQPDTLLKNPLALPKPDLIGGKGCTLVGNIIDAYRLRDLVGALRINDQPFKFGRNSARIGDGPDRGKSMHNTFWTTPDAVMNLSVGDASADGVVRFELVIGSGIVLNSPPSSYLVKAD